MSLFVLPDPPKDHISDVCFAPSSANLLVASWDGGVYLYDGNGGESNGNSELHEKGAQDETPTKGRLIARIGHPAPVLRVVFGRDGSEAFSACADWVVRRIDLNAKTVTPISRHTKAVNTLTFSPEFSMLLSGSWDKTVNAHILDGDSVRIASLTLPNKPFAMSSSASKVVIAMSHRGVNIYKLSDIARAVDGSGAAAREMSAAGALADEPEEDRIVREAAMITNVPPQADVAPWQRRESSLRYMTRAVACMPGDEGYASSSIEGRVAVEWFDPGEASQGRRYAFKCHRVADTCEDEDGNGNGQPVDVVFPVNALAFHPIGTFASGGGDGSVALWDGLAKRRIRQYHRLPGSVIRMSFGSDGRRLAIAVGRGFKDGMEEEQPEEGSVKPEIYIRLLEEGEARPKRK